MSVCDRFAFTAHSVIVRCGRWHEDIFGSAFYRDDDSWGSPASEADRLDDLVGKVVDGLFAEAVRLPLSEGRGYRSRSATARFGQV